MTRERERERKREREQMQRENERKRRPFDVNSPQTDPLRTSSGEKSGYS